eukprot:scaffold113707_cov17-Prasinocladus_malaysianus.AAC.1
MVDAKLLAVIGHKYRSWDAAVIFNPTMTTRRRRAHHPLSSGLITTTATSMMHHLASDGYSAGRSPSFCCQVTLQQSTMWRLTTTQSTIKLCRR